MLLAVGILGATVMPHVIFLHSALTQDRDSPRNETQARRILSFEIIDVVIAMGLAGLVNAAMLIMAASTFHSTANRDRALSRKRTRRSAPLLGDASSTVFAIAAGVGIIVFAVGTMAGQVIMQGFLNRTIPLWIRRA